MFGRKLQEKALVMMKTAPRSPGTDSLDAIQPEALSTAGPRGVVSIEGVEYIRPKSLRTQIRLDSDVIRSDRGTLSFWFSPMEDLGKAPLVTGNQLAAQLPLVGDSLPTRDVQKNCFSIYYRSWGYPRLIASFTDGDIWPQMDYDLAPYVYAEEVPLLKGGTYNLTLVWQKDARFLSLYLNGILVGENHRASSFEKNSGSMYFGNPLMAIGPVWLSDQAWDPNQVLNAYHRLRPAANGICEQRIRQIVQPRRLDPLDIERDPSWKECFSCGFRDPKDLQGWTLQTGDEHRDEFVLETTSEGLRWENPSSIDKESRAYLWGPFKVEGDIWVEFDFQIQSSEGLALIAICASGLQGEDVIDDHGLPSPAR